MSEKLFKYVGTFKGCEIFTHPDCPPDKIYAINKDYAEDIGMTKEKQVPCEPSSATAKQGVAWYDKSNGEVNKRLLATYTFKNNGLRYELELVRDLLKAYDAKCEELKEMKQYIDDTEAWEEFMADRILEARRKNAKNL